MIRFLEHRIGDRRIIRLIQKWLKASILEEEVLTVSDRGTGQGTVISPLLANIYLFYVFDLYALDTKLNLPPGARKNQLLAAMNSHILAKGQFTARYHR